ncbi:MAG: acetyl/propionyl/methylcrotonyl-CoA carboxylase subunit alpha [Proteobacteria bacterium]|nr:acetyl/propionyl/methylcrotonyl-CoA carboxylase subunit alpha [Pseudomonadota bacterium]
MFASLLIANRGEIACRIARTARRLAIRTIAVYSAADAGALHVESCDEAWPIGGADPSESYLNIARIIGAAQQAGAEAIHPGYGFLSENAAFAEACASAGIVFVGPPADAIRAMGSKSAAKVLLEKKGVPLVPGYHGDKQDLNTFAAEAERVGYPVLIKASAGWGGKGMRIVERAADLAAAIAGAKREASKGFADDRLLIEKYLDRPRHIEVQVFADGQGNVVTLFERDCSIQRRHQKVLEEAPAPGMTSDRRHAMGEAAIKVSRAIGYRGAGTVEFIMDRGGTFYFMEMNTRLQVEHPVTEMITGQDLVEWQLRVAAGERLPSAQDQLAITGHAIEVRLYAEDPRSGFLPMTGRIGHFRLPAAGRHVRIDAGVRAGDAIGIHYDPMIAKLIVWDETRDRALRRLVRALNDVQIAGLATNRDFLKALAEHPALAQGEVDTNFIDRHRETLLAQPLPIDNESLTIAALALLLRCEAAADAGAKSSADPHSPWATGRGWRLNDEGHHRVVFRDGETETGVMVHFGRLGHRVELPGATILAQGRLQSDGTLIAALSGHRLQAAVAFEPDAVTVFARGDARRLVVLDPLSLADADEGVDGRLAAPMPGRVVQVLVRPGERVEAGQPLVVLEAMKMEHTIKAPRSGTVATVNYGVGDQVEEGADLAELAEDE